MSEKKIKMVMEKLKHLLFALMVGTFSLTILVHAQDQSDFISLDCGLAPDSSYTESTTGINYISDATFIDTGVSKSILPEFQTNMQQEFWHVRSFPDGIRNCYELNLTQGDKYLIRASFMYGNYDEQDRVPEFDLYIGPNLWGTIQFVNASTVTLKEIIHIVSSNHLQVCLANTGLGTPFISALELRVLKNNTYVTQSGSLERFTRLDVASQTNRVIRYKDDVFDRMWSPYNSVGWAQLNTSLTIDAERNNYYQPPSIVMSTAATPENASQSLDFYIDTSDATLQFYVYMHFAEVEVLQANQSRQFNISLNNKLWYGPLTPDYLYTTTVYSPQALSGGTYEFSIYRTENSTLPPIINAIEIYSVIEFLQSGTNQKDVDAITNIKLMYGFKRNWEGDPCAPQAYSWDGLNCSYNGFDPPRITSLNLSSSGLTGEIPRYLSNLTMLTSLDLSNNSLNGSVPDFLSQLPYLSVLNLKGNMLNGSVPAELIERSKNGSLLLTVDGNPDLCASSSCKKKNSYIIPVVTSVGASLILLAAILAIIWTLKKRKHQVGRVETESNNKKEALELNNRQFTYSEILKITNNFERILGKGGFGTVYHGRIDDTEVAVKMLYQSSVQGYQQFQNEVKLLVRVHHRNLTSLVGYCNEDTNMALIYEYMANGNLEEHISGSNTRILSWESRLRIATEAAQGLEYLHSGCKPPIVHRDVKATNILLNEKFQAKLADFGLSRIFSVEGDTHVSTVVAGTPGYLDPEYYISNRLTEKSDVYSFGVVLMEIITGRPVIDRSHEKSDVYSFGVVLMEIITGRPVIDRSHEKTHISQWVSSMVTKGDIKNIVDPNLRGDFDTNSVWKAVELAMACVSQASIRRPTMNLVVMELSECLATQIARTSGIHNTESSSSIEMVTMNYGTSHSPLAR